MIFNKMTVIFFKKNKKLSKNLIPCLTPKTERAKTAVFGAGEGI